MNLKSVKYLLGFIILAFLQACGVDSEYECIQPPQDGQILLFIDKSDSSTEQLLESDSVFKSQLDRFLSKQLVNGHTIRGYFLHENTLGSTPFLDNQIKVPCPDIKGEDGFTRDNEQQKFMEAVQSGKLIAYQKVVDALQRSPDAQSQIQTDLWSTFELMSRYFDEGEQAGKRIAIYVSDMKESVRGPERRDLHRTLPSSRQEAAEWAKADAEIIRKLYKINDASLSKVEVVILYPVNVLQKGDVDMLRYYWEALFEAFGIKAIRESLVVG